MVVECVNLRETFGQRFKVTMEESYAAERGPGAWADDPWLQIIPGRRDHVYPWDLTRLAATTKTTGATAKRLRELAGVEVYVDASDGVTVLFPIDLLDQVAEVLLLKRRRRISEDERQRLATIGKQTQYGHGTGVRSEGLVGVPRAGLV